MALLISLIVTISNVYNGFVNTDKNKIKLISCMGTGNKMDPSKLKIRN